MVDHSLLRELDAEQRVDEELASMLGEDFSLDRIEGSIEKQVVEFTPGTILKGRVIGFAGNDVVVDVGLKSEGIVPISEWDDPSSVDRGDEVEVLLEAVDSDSGVVVLSKRKADRILNWERLLKTAKEGDKVSGTVVRKIKGGLMVDIGVPAFLPASQVDIRRPPDVGEYVGQRIEAKILKIDADRRNIVISRRKLIEEERARAKERLLAEIEEGQIRKGVVKNLADFGAFVDLGGLDGLLHITDMSWDRIGHPSEMLKIDQEIECVVLNVDREKEKIALGLKQKTPNPWETVEEKYPVGSRVKGTVVSLTNYGAFVKLEPGVEGLVHISEMSWTKRINHPGELLNVGDEIEVVVLDINKEKQEISLGLKQTEVNPWTRVAEKYPVNTIVEGTVRNLTNYGAFIELEEGIDGLLHVSDMSWTKKINHPSEMLKKGQKIKCVVLSVDEEKQRIALGLKQLTEDPWLRAVPQTYLPGQIVKGKVTKVTNFGVFVELEPELEGLLHVSELADHKVEDPREEVKVGDEIEVKIIRVDPQERKIGLSKKRAEWSAEEAAEGRPERKVRPRRGGLAGPSEVLGTDIVESVLLQPKRPAAPAEEAAGEAEASGPAEPGADEGGGAVAAEGAGEGASEAGPVPPAADADETSESQNPRPGE